MIVEMTGLAKQKQIIIARSESYRDALEADLRRVREAGAWLSTALKVSKGLLPLLAVLVPIAGFFVGRRLRSKPPAKSHFSWFERIMAGVQFYQRIRPIVESFMAARNASQKKESTGNEEDSRVTPR